MERTVHLRMNEVFDVRHKEQKYDKLTMTKESDAVVGVRKSDSYDGAIHGAAGWMTFNRDVKKIDPFNDAYRELGEELAVQPKDVCHWRQPF